MIGVVLLLCLGKHMVDQFLTPHIENPHVVLLPIEHMVEAVNFVLYCSFDLNLSIVDVLHLVTLFDRSAGFELDENLCEGRGTFNLSSLWIVCDFSMAFLGDISVFGVERVGRGD
jgi:hypothetical protein